MKISDHLHADIERHSKKHEEKKTSRKEAKGKVHHFKVTPAKGGYHVETHYEEPMGGGGALMGGEGESSIHKSSSSVKKHMDDCCGTVEGAE